LLPLLMFGPICCTLLYATWTGAVVWSGSTVKLLAPSCDEKTSVQKPGIMMPLPPNRR
jgi:hypothetical protein